MFQNIAIQRIWIIFMHKNKNLLCRVCGYENAEPPWGEDGLSPTFNFCPCCGVEFGYQDHHLESIRTYRENWLNKGASRDEPNAKLLKRSLENQMQGIPKEYL
jgi:hypothetical protein